MAEYEYVGSPGEDLPAFEEEVTIQLRKPDTMELFHARIIIHPPSEETPEGDVLYFTSATTGKDTTPHGFEMIEEIEGEEVEVTALPTQKMSLGQRKGRMLMDMINDRKKED